MTKLLANAYKHLHYLKVATVRRTFRDNAVPLGLVKRLRSDELYRPDLATSLFPPDAELISTPKALNNLQLQTLLGTSELGWWSLGAKTINYLENVVDVLKPQCILEFGSGISTLCLAFFARSRYHTPGSSRVLSVEQDEQQANKTLQLLSDVELQEYVNLYHAPLVECQIGGEVTVCYDLDPDFYNLLDDLAPELVVIDGPSGPPGCRYSTLPRIVQYLNKGTLFLMDDALRDPEIDIATRWQSMANITIHGVVLVEKGLLLGETN